MWDLNRGVTRRKASLLHTIHHLSLGSLLPSSLGLPAQHSTWHKSPRVCCLKGYLIYYGSISTLCISEHLIKWAALSWPLSLRVSRTGRACALTSPSSTCLLLLKLFFYTYKKFQGSVCFGRTYTKSGTIQGRLIISMTLAKEWCAHLWWFHIC